MGALLHRSPADQSTCAHLGIVMKGSSTVRNGRCDFHEPYGNTHSWRVLDADDNLIPLQGEEYYVAVWLQEHQSGKIGIAFGTWKEDFMNPYSITTPTCTRNMADFSEKGGNQASSFPVVACSSNDVSVSPVDTVSNNSVCLLGEVCQCSSCGDCANTKYDVQMGCGGEKCPLAVPLWDAVNKKMHHGMAINFTGDARVDFVRSMIPHHQGAVDMCEVLVLNLTCKTWENIGDLDGLIHFCNHVNKEQERELAGMREWLVTEQLEEKATCEGMNGMNAMHGTHHTSHTSDGCGNIHSPSSLEYIEINRQMHSGMAINFSCQHEIDFVRGMIPHHAGAVAMCNVLETHLMTSPDAYLSDLCANITRLQRAEIAWMSMWLANRDFPIVSSCMSCAKVVQPSLPCEDILPSTSFCHLLGGDYLCKCEKAIEQYPCGTLSEVTGFAVLNTSAECQRTCGLCPSDHAPLFQNASCSQDQMNHLGHMDHMTNGSSSSSMSTSMAATFCESSFGLLATTLLFASLWF